MKIFLIGWFGAGNLGDEAILVSEIIFLKGAIPDCEFHVLSFDPGRTSILVADIPEVKKILRIGAKQNVIRSDFFGVLKSFWEVDLVIIGGGGIFQDIYNHYPIPFFTTLALMSRFFRKKLVLYCLGIGPVHTRIGKVLCRMAAGAADMVSVRDPESGELLKELGVKKEIGISADPVFLLESVRNSKVETIIKAHDLRGNGQIVGVCVQDLLAWDDANRLVLANVLDEISEEKQARIVFLPFGGYRDKWFGNEDADSVDVAASKKIGTLMAGKYSIVCEEPSPGEMLALMEEMDIVISMRLHGLIMGLTAGVPVVALTYKEESKIRNLMRRLGQEENLFNVRKLQKQELLSRTHKLLADSDRVKKQIVERISDLREEVKKYNSLLLKALGR